LSLRGIVSLREKPHLFERFFGGLLPYDHLVIVYSWIMIVIAVNFVRPIENYLGLVAFHLGAIAVAGLLSHFVKSNSPRIALFFRLLYPFILMTFFYQFCGQLVGTVVPDLHDHRIVSLEKSLFGVNPTLWLDQHPNVFLTELMSAGYLSYYIMIPGLSLLLFFTRRDAEIRRFVTAGCVTFFASYLIFILYPAAGPRFHLDGLYQNTLTGPVLRPLVMFVIDNAAFRGGAMPSSHVAVAVVVLFFTVRSFRKRGWLLSPVVLALALGTVYGRFHYVSDVVVGVLMGIIIPWLTLMFYPTKRDYSRIWDLSEFDRKGHHVSDSV
jgi:membrane-associated phospholipid phosphatase